MTECLQFNKAIDGEKAWKPPAASQLPRRAKVPGKSTPLALVPKSVSSQQSVSHEATREKANRIVPQVLSHPGFLTGMAAGRLPGPSPACCQNDRGGDPSRPLPPGARGPICKPSEWYSSHLPAELPSLLPRVFPEHSPCARSRCARGWQSHRDTPHESLSSRHPHASREDSQ